MKVLKTKVITYGENDESRDYRLSLIKLFGKYYVYFSINVGKPKFWNVFCSVYIHKTENPVDPLEAPFLFRDRLDRYCGKKSLYLV